ncbi:hypothetical protein ACH3XW_23725 [Acanthocheilonema viteae]
MHYPIFSISDRKFPIKTSNDLKYIEKDRQTVSRKRIIQNSVTPMMSNVEKKREYFSRRGALSLSAPTRRKWYKKVPPMNFRNSTTETNYLDLSMSRISNQLIGAVATWHDIHTSLMKVGLSSDNVSSDEVTKAPFNSSSSASSSYSTDSLISFIGNDSLSGNQSSDENLDDEKLFNYHSRLSISNMELRNSQLKEIFPRLSEHWSRQKWM